MLLLAFSLLLFNVFFGQLVPNSIAAAAFASGTYLLGLSFIYAARNSKSGSLASPLTSIWLIFSILIFVSYLVTATQIIIAVLVLFVTLALLVASAVSTGWIVPCLRVLLIYSMIHVFATIAFYLAPGLYDVVVGSRFEGGITEVGYVSGLAHNFTHNAMYCSIAFLLAGSKALVASNRPRLYVAVGLAFVALVAVFLTTKRAHLIFAIVALCVVLVYTSMRGKYLKLALGGIGGLFAVRIAAGYMPGIAASIDRFENTFDSGSLQAATSGRTLVWEFAINGWSDRPWLGNGWASYVYIWPDGKQRSIHSHNAILNALYEVGVVGAVLLIVATLVSFVVTVKLILRIRATSVDSFRFPLYFALGMQTFSLLHAYTSEELLRNFYSFVPYLLAVSIAVAVSARLDSEYEKVNVVLRSSNRHQRVITDG